MNQKGFTFVELIAIILILAAICLVSFPAILNTAKQSDKNAYEQYKNTICLGAKTYINDSNDSSEESEQIEFTVEQLVVLGYIEPNLNNPKTDTLSKLDTSTVILTKNSDGVIECVYNEIEENN